MSDKIPVIVDADIADLIPGFLNNRAKDVATLRDRAERGDFDAVRMLGHSMKGAGGGYGFDRISEIGATIETAAGRTDARSVLAAADALEDYLARVEITFEEV